MTTNVKKFFSKREECRQTPGACMKSSLRRVLPAYLPAEVLRSIAKPVCLKACIIAAILISTPGGVLFSQTPAFDIRREIDELKQNMWLIQKDLLEIKLMLSRQPVAGQQPALQQQPQMPPPQMDIAGVGFDLEGAHILGSISAKLVMVEFSDYECPFCGRHARETFPEIRKQYIDKGIIRYAVADNPLTVIHPFAAKAAEAAHCAGVQGKYWEAHEAMMAKQDGLKDLTAYAKELKLDIKRFEACLDSGEYTSAVKSNMSLAGRLGISGVPAFIIGATDNDDPGKVTAISVIRGALPFESFKREIDAALNAR